MRFTSSQMNANGCLNKAMGISSLPIEATREETFQCQQGLVK